MQWADDCNWVIEQASNALVALGYDPDKELKGDVAFAVRHSLRLIWSRNPSAGIQYRRKSYNKWSKLKKGIVSEIANRSKAVLDIVQAANVAEEDLAVEDSEELDLLALREFVSSVSSSCSARSGRIHVTLLPMYRMIVDNAKVAIEATGDNIDKLSIRRLCVIAVKQVDAVIHPQWIGLLTNYLDEPATAPQASKDKLLAIFPKAPKEGNGGNGAEPAEVDEDQAVLHTNLRAQFVFHALQDITQETEFRVRYTFSELGESFPVDLSAKETMHSSSNVRATFWSSLWQLIAKLPANVNKRHAAVTHALDQAHETASGNLLAAGRADTNEIQYMPGSDFQAEARDGRVAAAMVEGKADLSDDKSIIKSIKDIAVTPGCVKTIADVNLCFALQSHATWAIFKDAQAKRHACATRLSITSGPLGVSGE